MSFSFSCTSLPRGLRVAALALAVVGTGASCAEMMGKRTSSGLIEGIRATNTDDPTQQVFRIAGERIVGGGLEAFDDPAQKERVRALVTLVADEAVKGALGALDEAQKAHMRGVIANAADQAVASAVAAFDDPVRQQRLLANISAAVQQAVAGAQSALIDGPNGEPGRASVLAGQIASAATADAMHQLKAGLSEMFPGCAGRDPETCRREWLRDLSREAGAGLSAGVLQSLKWPLLLLTGGFCLILGLLLGLLVRGVWTAGPHRPAGHDHPTGVVPPGRLRTHHW